MKKKEKILHVVFLKRRTFLHLRKSLKRKNKLLKFQK